MTPLEQRDRRRATRIVFKWRGWRMENEADELRDMIAAALRREREETSMSAAHWFLFAGKNERAKVKRVVSKPGAKSSFATIGNRRAKP